MPPIISSGSAIRSTARSRRSGRTAKLNAVSARCSFGRSSASLLPILTDALGGLLTFVALGLFYRFQRHRRITDSQAAQDRFRSTKRLLALVLLVIFIGIGLQDVWAYLARQIPGRFFETFFTLLVFSDILLIFLSLRYTTNYQVVFRNSGFALATVFIRLAVTAPTYYNVALSLGSVAFAVCLPWLTTPLPRR